MLVWVKLQQFPSTSPSVFPTLAPLTTTTLVETTTVDSKSTLVEGTPAGETGPTTVSEETTLEPAVSESDNSDETNSFLFYAIVGCFVVGIILCLCLAYRTVVPQEHPKKFTSFDFNFMFTRTNSRTEYDFGDMFDKKAPKTQKEGSTFLDLPDRMKPRTKTIHLLLIYVLHQFFQLAGQNEIKSGTLNNVFDSEAWWVWADFDPSMPHIEDFLWEKSPKQIKKPPPRAVTDIDMEMITFNTATSNVTDKLDHITSGRQTNYPISPNLQNQAISDIDSPMNLPDNWIGSPLQQSQGKSNVTSGRECNI